MNKYEIFEAVSGYINNEKAKYAVLIDAPWGSGKTYLYENFLADKIAKNEAGKNQRKTNAYISLYGISTIEDLSKELLTNYMLKTKCNDNDIKEKIYKVSSGIASVMSKAISISVGPVTLDFGEIGESLKNSIDIKDMVICFDDLERCSIPINNLFGFINNLVEHCNCKVLILADEANIGKMFANSNIEAKYISLLSGKKLVKGVDDKGNKKPTNTDEGLTIEQLKQLNEELYSENYVYKDIKEKVIGMSLVYALDLGNEIEDIIEETLRDKELKEKLKRSKDDILQHMSACGNRNIRIVHVWLIKFEQIFRTVKKYFAGSEYFENVCKNFMAYSIYVACMVGKNQKLTIWERGTEWGTVKFEVSYLRKWIEGYKFIDDLYTNAIFDEKDVCKAAKYIIDQKKSEAEEMERIKAHGSALKESAYWIYMEDLQVEELLNRLRQELIDGMYIFQEYKDVLDTFFYLRKQGFCVNDLNEIQRIMIENVDMAEEITEIKEHPLSFDSDEEKKEFYQYYTPIYEHIMEKCREKDKEIINASLEYENAKNFEEYCKENDSLFIKHKTFMNYIDIDLLLNCIKKSDLEGIYHIIEGINRVYGFQNIYEFFAQDVDLLKELKEEIQNPEIIEWRGRTGEHAKNYFIDSLDKILTKLEMR